MEVGLIRPAVKWLLMLEVALAGCTSLGHGGREEPKVARPVGVIQEVGIDGDDNTLAVGVENLLESRGIKARMLSTKGVREQRGDKEYEYDESRTRYVVRVRSLDRDHCMPGGGRQMDFYISVMDLQERTRVFLMNGDHGCEDSILQKFDAWLERTQHPAPK